MPKCLRSRFKAVRAAHQHRERGKLEMIKLGSKAKDIVTGFTGIVTMRCIHITGCDRYAIQPPKDKDGKYVDDRFFDENSIEVLDEGVSAKFERATPEEAADKTSIGVQKGKKKIVANALVG